MSHPETPLTDEILEDCLQAVYRAELEHATPDPERLAAFARVPAPVVQQALGELEARALLSRNGLAAPRLTEQGRREASGILRRHRLSERLLTDILGIPWERAHEEAMRYEHTLTADGEARLAELLEHPETCPHGRPIPEASRSIRPGERHTLDGVPAGTRARIRQVREEEVTFLRYLASLGLLPQVEVRVEEVAPFGGPLLVRVGTAQYALGRDVCAKIVVEVEPATPAARHRRRRRQGGRDGGC
jgi:DtxR family Mn-dependent transcriptional regulator